MQAGPLGTHDRPTGADPAVGMPVVDEVSFVEIMGVLYRQRALIAAITGIGIILGVLVALISPRIYVAQAKVLPTSSLSTSSDVSALSQLRGAAALVGLGMGSGITNVSPLFPQLLSSKDLIGKILARKYPLRDSSKVDLIDYLKIKRQDPDKTLQVATLAFRKVLRCTFDMKSGVTTISASFKDPVLAAAVVNAGTEELDLFLQELKTSQAGQKARFVSQRLTEVQTELQRAEDALKTFRERNRQTLGSPLLMLEEARFSRDVAVNEQMFITLKTQYEIARIDAVRDLSDIAVVEKATPPLYRSKLPKILVGTTMLFGFFGIVIALSRQWFDEFKRVIKIR